jgi:large subunit ribosomal protein L10
VVLAHNTGLNAADIFDLRNKVRNAKGRFRVTKNRLLARALKGTQFDGLSDKLTGPTAIVCGEDIYALTKTVVTFTKGNQKLKVIAGANGSEIMDAASVDAMSKLPSMNEMRSMFVGLLQAPASKMARVLSVYANSKQGDGETPAA